METDWDSEAQATGTDLTTLRGLELGPHRHFVSISFRSRHLVMFGCSITLCCVALGKLLASFGWALVSPCEQWRGNMDSISGFNLLGESHRVL